MNRIQSVDATSAPALRARAGECSPLARTKVTPSAGAAVPELSARINLSPRLVSSARSTSSAARAACESPANGITTLTSGLATCPPALDQPPQLAELFRMQEARRCQRNRDHGESGRSCE